MEGMTVEDGRKRVLVLGRVAIMRSNDGKVYK